ncbi:hypothetical protein [uncultured Clostridium sp.]|uniref:hypothetical protein n=1 Tax=uncultured Clostridium sp. TaxID=59620 RepID=UPI0026288EB7|nr:hypothetical protein [uncultured Clostridium sp.]
MSVRHIKNYYEQVSSQYKEMLAELKDFEQLAEDKMFPPERLEQIKQTITPLKDNYERWSYMMFLLNQPNRNQKVKKYQKQNEKLLKMFDKKNSIEGTLEENNNVLNTLKNNN